MSGTKTNAWRSDAACVDTPGDEWFPPGRSIVNPLVLRVCAACPVWRDCLLYALANPELRHGIWAGLMPLEVVGLRERLMSGELGPDVVQEARNITENRGPETQYQTAVAHPLPSRREQRQQRHNATDVLVTAGLLDDSRDSAQEGFKGRAA